MFEHAWFYMIWLIDYLMYQSFFLNSLFYVSWYHNLTGALNSELIIFFVIAPFNP